MKLVKLFETSDMEDWLFQELRERDCFVKDGSSVYVVGYFSNEIRNGNPEDYRPGDLEMSDKIDSWFVERGASIGDGVLVYHGKWI